MSFDKLKLPIIVGLSCFLIGKYVFPPKQKIKIKEVIKYVEKKEETKKTKTITKIKETTKPDGSVDKETTITEDSSSQTNTSITASKDTEKEISSGSGITLGILAIKDIPEFSKRTELAVLASIPVVGKLSIVGTADTTKRVGIGVALEF